MHKHGIGKPRYFTTRAGEGDKSYEGTISEL
jgi:hypothetical protein